MPEDPSKTHILASLHKSCRNFFLNPEISSQFSHEKPWLVVKSLNAAEYLLTEGDKFKLGKVKLKVKEINGFRQSDNKKNMIHSNFLHNGGAAYSTKCSKAYKTHSISSTLENLNCRICLSDESSNDNPLISPCHCSGTMAVTHLECLKKWLSCKVTNNTFKNIQVYSWKSLHCELCSFKYPNKLMINDLEVDLVAVNKPLTSYLVLQTGKKDSKLLHIVALDDKKVLKFGRSHDCDLRFADISVSRNHAIIRIKASGLFLEDQRSKFGTVVRLNKNLAIDPDCSFKVQTGRTVLKFSLQRPWSFLACFNVCGRGKVAEEDLQHQDTC